MLSKTIQHILLDKDVKQIDLAQSLGTTPQNLFAKFKHDNFRESDLRAIADALGCDLVIQFVDRETGRVY